MTRSLLAFSLIVFCAARANGAVLNGGDLRVSLDDRTMSVSELTVSGTRLRVNPQPFVSLCDVSTGRFDTPIVSGGTLPAEAVLRFENAKATVTLSIESVSGALRVHCRLVGDPTPPRGVLLRFALPFDAEGWRWHSDMQTAATIAATGIHENVRPLRAYADLPEWRDEPDLRMGYSNRNFCTVLTGPVGLCLAVPIDRPCLFRTAYNADEKRLEVLYDLALTEDSREPRAAEFSFELYACDPTWGFRSALQHYYALHPDLFAVHIREQGQWMAFSRLSQIDNANEFHFGLQEGAPETAYDDKLNVLSTIYFTHAGMGANIPDHDPEADPLPPHEEQVAAMEAAFKRRTGEDGMYRQVGLHDASGKLDVKKWRVYAHLIAQFNLDPELPYGKWTLQQTNKRTQRAKQSGGGVLDGFYYDGLSAGINYRTDHAAKADSPCLWDPVARKPFINNFFSSCEFARAAAELLRPKGQVTMMNGAMGASFFVAPWLDVLGAETGLRISREDLNYIRTIAAGKPFLTLLKGNYEQRIGKPEVELFMKRCLAYGVFPGFFDWPPSGLGPGGRYWDHPRYFERDRDLHRRILPLCHALATDGWQPLTHAHASAADVFVERFGPGPDGITWFTVLNEGRSDSAVTLTIDASRLGNDPSQAYAVEILTGTRIPLRPEKEGTLCATLNIAPDDMALLQVAPPAHAARWHLSQALTTLDRGVRMGHVDRTRPPLAVHWVPGPGTPAYSRTQEAGKPCLAFRSDGTKEQSCRQWVMLFQAKPEPLTLRVRARTHDVQGPEGTVGIRCRLAWVTASYSHYETRFFDIPGGTRDWQDIDFTIHSDHALRAVQLTPIVARGATGSLDLSRLSLTDPAGADHVVDPRFTEWYEPIPDQLRPGVDASCSAVRDALAAAHTALAEPGSAAAREALLTAGGRTQALRSLVLDAKAENACRRVLRDTETIDSHLGSAALAVFPQLPLTISAPLRTTPGGSFLLALTPTAIADTPCRADVSAEGATVRPRGNTFAVDVPEDAPIGSSIRLSASLHLGTPGRTLAANARSTVAVVAPLEATLAINRTAGLDGPRNLTVRLRNNGDRRIDVSLDVAPPPGWSATKTRPVTVSPGTESSVDVRVTPSEEATPGTVMFACTATAGAHAVRRTLTFLFIPSKANLLKDPGFEQGADAWGMNQGSPEVVDTEHHSGGHALQLRNQQPADSSASQSVVLNQITPCPVLVRAWTKAQAVSGKPGKGYSLYVDIYYTDGTPLYGQTFDFATGTTDWQPGELTIEPEKPIRNVNVYLLLRRKTGTAFFDDIALMEDPRRKGNLARTATVSVDSCYANYDSSPINDGAVEATDLHWTKEAWASNENEQEHFVALTFPQPVTIARATIHWSLDAGLPRTSRRIDLQVRDGEEWRTLSSVEPGKPVPATSIQLPTPTRTRELRILQPAGMGPQERPGLMWIREVEVFSPQ